MAIAFDTQNNQFANATSTSCSLTIASGATLLIWVISNGAQPTPTWNGSATGVTLLQTNTQVSSQVHYVYSLANATSGTHTLASGTSSGATAILLMGISVTGADATNPIQTSQQTNTGASSTLTGTITTTQANEFLVGFASNDVNRTDNTNGTSIFQDASYTNGRWSYIAAPTAGSNSLTYQVSSGSPTLWASDQVALQLTSASAVNSGFFFAAAI